MPSAGTVFRTASPPSRSSMASRVATPCADFNVRTGRKRSAIRAGAVVCAPSVVAFSSAAPSPSPARCAGNDTRSLFTRGVPLAETARGPLGGQPCQFELLLLSTVEGNHRYVTNLPSFTA
jgi:hypothetical protein